jgi:putative pyrroloquinoline-quinone binding quinoprotein
MGGRPRCIASIVIGSALIVSIGLPAAAATPGSRIWGRPNAAGNELAVGPDGEMVYIAGGPVVARKAATGVPVWSNFPAFPLEHVAVSPDGTTVFAAGVATDATQYDRDFFTVALDAVTGATEWSKRFDSPVDPGTWGSYDEDHPYDIGVSPDGKTVFVTGVSDGRTSPQDFVTISYDATSGAKVWSDRYSGADPFAGDLPSALAVSPDGSKVFVTGESYQGAETAQDFLTIAHDAVSGDRLWIRRFGGLPEGAYDTPHDIAVGPAGRRVFVVGGVQTDTSTGYADVGVVAYRASTGHQAWGKRLGASGTDDGAESIAVNANGVYVTGFSGLDIGTIALDTGDGSTQWKRLYDGPGGQNDLAFSVATSGDGSMVFIAGQECAVATADCGGGTGYRFATLAYDTLGQLSWARGYSGPVGNSDSAQAVAANPLGGAVYVTGFTGTLAYAA